MLVELSLSRLCGVLLTAYLKSLRVILCMCRFFFMQLCSVIIIHLQLELVSSQNHPMGSILYLEIPQLVSVECGSHP